MRYRITVRGQSLELRGYLDGEPIDLSIFAPFMAPYGVVVASVAADDYDPFKDEQMRELHHFETEQENAALKEELRIRREDRGA